MSNHSLPVHEPPSSSTGAGESDVWGIILAAGTSSRFGDRNKLLQEIAGEPMIRRVTENMLKSALAEIVVVVGYESAKVRSALSDFPVRFVENEEYTLGQSTSVRTGVSLAREHDVDAVLIALGDMPYVSPDSIDALVTAYESDVGLALAAAYNSKRGNPVLFDERYFSELTSVSGDMGGRQILFESDYAALVETRDSGVRRDIDRPSDYQHFDTQ